MRSAPAATTARISSPSRAKSAERIDGAMKQEATGYNRSLRVAAGVPMAERARYEITVVPKASYVEDQSDPSKNQYVFAYTITISNTGTVPAQLVSRHWIITDANG